MTDSKFPDFQAGAERAGTILSAALAGANLVYESAGMYASLLGTCPESLLLDNDVLGAALRVTRGIEVNAETLGFDEIKQVCTSGGGPLPGFGPHSEGHAERIYLPGFRRSHQPHRVGGERQAGSCCRRPSSKSGRILASHFPKHVSDEADLEVRSRFPIFLSPGKPSAGLEPE